MTSTDSINDQADESSNDPWEESATESDTLAQSTPSWKRTLRLIGFLLLGVMLVAIGVKQLTSQVLENKMASEAATNSLAEQKSNFHSKPDTLSNPQPENVIATSEATRRSKVLEAQSDIQTAQVLLGRLTKEQKRWEDFVSAVSVDEVGQRLAADDKAVELFAAALDHDRLSSTKTAGLRQSLLTIAQPIEQAVADDSATLVIDNEFTQQLSDIRSQLELGLRQWQEDNALVRLLANEAKSRDPAGITLSEAIEKLRAIRLRQRAEQIAAELKASEKALTKQKAASQIELQELETQKQLERDKVEAERKRAELAGLKAEQIALADQIAAARAKAKLEREFQAQLPEIRSVLVPFLSNGHKQLVNGKWTYLEEKQPLSFSGLKSIAVLDGDQMSFQRLFFVAGGRKNDRPSGPFPNYIGGHIHDNNMPLARKAQRLLNTFGELMVEKGMLRP